MKKLIGIFAAAALLFSMAGCSNDDGILKIDNETPAFRLINTEKDGASYYSLKVPYGGKLSVLPSSTVGYTYEIEDETIASCFDANGDLDFDDEGKLVFTSGGLGTTTLTVKYADILGNEYDVATYDITTANVYTVAYFNELSENDVTSNGISDDSVYKAVVTKNGTAGETTDVVADAISFLNPDGTFGSIAAIDGGSTPEEKYPQIATAMKSGKGVEKVHFEIRGDESSKLSVTADDILCEYKIVVRPAVAMKLDKLSYLLGTGSSGNVAHECSYAVYNKSDTENAVASGTFSSDATGKLITAEFDCSAIELSSDQYVVFTIDHTPSKATTLNAHSQLANVVLSMVGN